MEENIVGGKDNAFTVNYVWKEFPRTDLVHLDLVSALRVRATHTYTGKLIRSKTLPIQVNQTFYS